MKKQGLKLQWLASCVLCSVPFLGCAQNVKYVPARDTNFEYVGRTLKMPSGAMKYSLPGVSVYGAFEGPHLDLVVKEFGGGGFSTTNYLAVIIDNSTPYLIRLNQKDTIYPVSSTLTSGIHNVQIVKRTESQVGSVEFRGIRVQQNATVAKHSSMPQTKLLSIGNSITCGYGNDTSITVNPTTGFTSKHENNYNSYGHVAARSLKAQYAAFAYSGRGLYKNIDGSTSTVIPSIFDRIFPDDASYTWDHATYVPNWIVVNLGTNDFSSEINGYGRIDSSTFVSKYLTFVSRLKQLYPSAQIILAVGPMMSDGYPTNGRHWTRIQAYVNSVVNKEKQAGNTRISFLAFQPQSSPYGEDWHPSTQTHQIMGNQLANFIGTLVTSLPEKENATENLIVFPNPAKEYIKVKNSEKGFPINVYDTKGNLILSKYATGEEMRMELHSLPKGVYILKNDNRSVSFVVE